MANGTLNIGAKVAIKKTQLNNLISSLQDSGFRTIGPKVRDNAITLAPIDSLDDLPLGYISEQECGFYRLIPGKHERYFDVTPGADSWKKFLFPPRSRLFEVSRENGNWQTNFLEGEPPQFAFIGVRPCELSAISVQDRVFIREDYVDPIYKSRRENILIIAVACTHPSSTCFCTSMGTGPRSTGGFDLSFIEMDDVFLVEVGSEAGAHALQPLEWERAIAYRLQLAEAEFLNAERSIQRHIENLDMLPEILLNNYEHPLWDQVGARCLSCTNCTLVCPTCFCWDVEDLTDLSGDITRRERVWDSCFNPSYSAQAGGNTRPTTKSRYRQWLTHKMGSWVEQFGESGCVGCGRCITWCPAKIDITAEIINFQEAAA
jgi:sulfhydrogenase subunit beta (sulfur reductase)